MFARESDVGAPEHKLTSCPNQACKEIRRPRLHPRWLDRVGWCAFTPRGFADVDEDRPGSASLAVPKDGLLFAGIGAKLWSPYIIGDK